LRKDRKLLEQEFANDTSSIGTAYSRYIDHPTSEDIENVKSTVKKRNDKINEIVTNTESLKTEYLKQRPSVSQKIELEKLRYEFQRLELHREQAKELNELMDYSESLDFTNLSSSQKSHFTDLQQEINDTESSLLKLQFQIDNSNLDIQ